jgi:hypothetical protein
LSDRAQIEIFCLDLSETIATISKYGSEDVSDDSFGIGYSGWESGVGCLERGNGSSESEGRCTLVSSNKHEDREKSKILLETRGESGGWSMCVFHRKQR